MKKFLSVLCVLAACCFVAHEPAFAQRRVLRRAAPVTIAAPVVAQPEGITQVATIDSLLAGVYDGEMTLAELGRHGDFGIGTFDRLDGEMVLADGVFYQVRGDGKVYRPSLQTKTPFASVMFFPKNTKAVPVGAPLDYEAICRKIDELAPNMNVPVAVRLEGKFSGVRTRSVPAQQKPYRPLAEVTATQPEFDLGNIAGMVVGFRLPAYVRGINVPGYHLHFLSDDFTRGGHILHLSMDTGTIRLAPAHRFQIVLPQNIADFSTADLAKDRSEELERVEK